MDSPSGDDMNLLLVLHKNTKFLNANDNQGRVKNFVLELEELHRSCKGWHQSDIYSCVIVIKNVTAVCPEQSYLQDYRCS